MFSVVSIESVAFAVLCFVSVFWTSDSMLDSDIINKWTVFLLLLCVVSVVLLSKVVITGNLKCNFRVFINIIICISTIQVLYLISQKLFINNTHIYLLGSFHNHSGFSACLCLALPYIYWKIGYSDNNKIILLNVVLAVLYGYAIILSGSRIGIIVFFTIPIIIFFTSKKRCGIFVKISALISISITILVLYYLRPESANGRVLIWLSSLEAFKEAPWFGHGQDFFQRLYMFYQARYLQLNPDSKFVMLADTVQFPFNEYVRVILNWGLVGFCLIIFAAIWFYKKYVVEFNEISLTVATIAILSLTSYPFSYPFTWIVVCFSLLYAYGKHSFCFNKKIKSIAVLIIIFAIVNVNHIYSNYKMQCMWHFADKTNDIDAYDRLYVHLKENPYFLYNYSIRLFIIGDILNSKKIALECRKKYADYDLELLIGDIYFKENNYDEALNHYNLCSNMCPCRFIPIYQKFLVSIKTNNKIQASLLAHEIIEKQIKIPSQTITMIKMQAENYLKAKEI